MYDTDDVVFFSPGSVLQRSFSILGGELPLFLLLTALVYAPFVAATMLASQLDFFQASMALSFASLAISLICQPLATATLIHGVFRRLRGERASLSDSLQVAFSRILPVLGFSFLSALLCGVGFMLCIIPGIIMTCMLYVGLPVVVVEGKGPIDAIRRSDGLTSGFRWGIFGLIVVIGLLQFALNSGFSVLMQQVFSSQMMNSASDIETMMSGMNTYMIVSQLFSYGIQILTTALSSVFVTVAYHDLRVSRDGIDSDDLVSVFD